MVIGVWIYLALVLFDRLISRPVDVPASAGLYLFRLRLGSL